MNSNVQAGLVQLGIAGLLLFTWYTGAWQVIVDELSAGIAGRPRRFDPASSLDAGGGAGGVAVPPAAGQGAGAAVRAF